MALNPYSPEAIRSISYVVGRNQQLTMVERLAEEIELGKRHAPRGFLAPTGYGKTTLLKTIAASLTERNWICGYAEASKKADTSLKDLVLDLERALPRRSNLKKIYQRIRGLSLSAGPAGVSVDLANATTESLYMELRALFERLVEFAYVDGTGVALFIDEAQVLEEDILALLRAHTSLEDLPILLIFAGLPGLPEIIGYSKMSGPHIYYYELELLSYEDAKSLLTQPLLDSDGEILPTALGLLLKWASGHPLVLQMLGSHAWEAAYLDAGTGEGPVLIGEPHAETAVHETRSILERGYYRPWWTAMSDSERTLVKAVAAGNDIYALFSDAGPILDDALTELESKGILASKDDAYHNITLPGFTDFILSRP